MSDFSRSDLRDVEQSLNEISRALSGSAFSTGAGEKLSRMNDLLEKVVSRLDDISRKLDQR